MKRTPVADWQQLSALYEVATALEPGALDGWLTQLKQQPHPLLGQLEQMLDARVQVAGMGFLGTLPKIRLDPEPGPRVIELKAGSLLGVYRLQRRIGSGGMAEVWLALRDDGVFDRQVAIKLLFRNERSDARDSFAQRFERERHILASLDHPNIAGLHDAGVTRDGQPWLALEYVEGQMLTTWCDARHLGVRERVQLFQQVLLAVQHAHANLVIHRDLKPGNILVTAGGEVRLLDFGIAKLIEPEGGAAVETELTRMNGRPMTPQYAAPEQLLGQPLTTSCDVYSLGVVLYELLCGELPYELKVDTAAQLEQAIVDTEPRAPSRRALSEATAMTRGTNSTALRKTLASDLDAIVLRALAKSPAQRYASVEALRTELDRWLAGEPVEARAPSTVYRVGKFVRRHRLSVSLGMGAVLGLIGVTAVAVVMGLQAREDSARAVAARDFMLNIFSRANQEKSRGADITARDLLETGRKDVMTRLARQPALQVELLGGIAKIQRDMGEYVNADGTFRDLVRLLGELHRPREEVVARLDHALNAISIIDLGQAARLLEAAKAVPHGPTDDPEIEARIAELTGWIAVNSGKPKEARAPLVQARSKAVAALGEAHIATFRLGRALLRAERDDRDFDAALKLHAELAGVADRVAGLDADELVTMDLEFANVLVSAGRFQLARRFLESTSLRCEQLLGPQQYSCRFLFVKLHQVLLRQGELDRSAEAVSRLGLIAADALFPFQQLESQLLLLRLTNGRDDEAARVEFNRLLKLGLSGREVALPVAFKAAALLGLAESRLRAGDARSAREWINRANTMLADVSGQSGVGRLQSVAQMLTGVADATQSETALASSRLESAIKGFASELGEDHPLTRLFDVNRAMVLVEMNRRDDAVKILRRSERVLLESLGQGSPAYLRVADYLRRVEMGRDLDSKGVRQRRFASVFVS
jgi:eukaryotic-like serine/threonine-protein kinase